MFMNKVRINKQKRMSVSQCLLILLCLVLLGASLSSSARDSWAENLPEFHGDNAFTPIKIDSLKVLDLQTAIKLALAKNPSLAAAQERIEQASARVRQARASYWPLLDISGSATRLDMSGKSFQQASGAARMIDPQATVTNPESMYTSSLGARWLLFDGFARKYGNLAARYAEQESVQARADRQRLLISAVATTFYTAQLAREDIAIAKADQAFNQDQMEEAKARRRVGTGSLSDVLNFTIQVNGAKAALISAKQGYEIAMSGLAALLGLESAFPALLDISTLPEETLAEMALPDLEPLIQTALDNRPDIIQKNLLIDRSEASKKVAQAAYYPTISLAAGLDGERTHDAHFTGDDFGNSLTLLMSYNLFDGGTKRAKISEELAIKRAAVKEVAALGLEIRSEVREAMIRLRLAQEKVILLRDISGLVQQNRDLVKKEFAAGQVSLVRLNEAQRDLTRVRGELALGIVVLRQAWQDMAVVTGQEDPANIMAIFSK